MEHPRTVLTALAATALTAVICASPAAATSTFSGDVCALVTPAAARAAAVDAPCVQSKAQPVKATPSTTYVAAWGTATAGSEHYMAVQVGPIRSITLGRLSKLFPRGPGKLLGPILVAPGIKAYYLQSAYEGVAGGRGTMKLVDKGHLVQITILNASGNVLPGLEAVAKAVASKM
jgi:hypothetical protein